MNDQTNSATRLLSILRNAQGKSENTRIHEVWANVLKPQFGEETGDLHYWLFELRRLVSTVEEEISSVPRINQDLYLRPFSSIRSALEKTNLDAPWRDVKQHLNETVMTGLEHCAELLSRERPEPVIPQGELSDLFSKTNALIDDITSSALPTDLKSFLVGCLERIRKAILLYRIHGASALREAFETTIGAAILQKNLSDLEGSDDEQTTKNRFQEILSILSRVLVTANAVKGLAEPFLTNLLSSG